MTRRALAANIVAALAFSAFPVSVMAQESFPVRPVRVIVGFPAGTATDITTRIYADKLSAQFNQRFVVENMPGAATNLAAAAAARSNPDGYTLYVATNANSISVNLYRKLQYRFPDDFAPIATMVSVPTVLVAGSGFAPSTLQDVIRLAKEKPGEVTYGSAGVGTGPQLAGELMVALSNIKLTHIPYKGTNEAIADLMTGRISLLFAALPVVSEHIRDGRLKAIAITTEQRSSLAPNIPTISESGIPGFDVLLWFGLVAPKGTPEPIVRAIASAVGSIQQQEDLKQRLAAVGAEPLSHNRDGFAKFIDADIPKWAKAVEHSGLKMD